MGDGRLQGCAVARVECDDFAPEKFLKPIMGAFFQSIQVQKNIRRVGVAWSSAQCI